ncbi:uncharacterized protein LOC126909174 [Daktulosphaira vitifoliae]|uniref:uncharacterized protein LOC126909174 n=1 Tax=Daktulosphaira vitifoliae TaxID=58002 RepID=UPI0021AA1A2A|nr:uncharacterized protein LOC126909174 [Daktulosphaira vitifoliae]
MRCHNILLLICIFICITSVLAGKKGRVKKVKDKSSSKSTEVKISNDETLTDSINKINLSDKTDVKSPTTQEENNTLETQDTLIQEENNTPKTQSTLIKEENNIPETQSTLIKNDATAEQISLLTTIYNSVTSNDTNKLTITDLKSIFNKLDLVKKDEEYDVMMKFLDSDNDNKTGLDKFLKLFTLNSQKEKPKKIANRSVIDKSLFKFYSNGQNYIYAKDFNKFLSSMTKEDRLNYPIEYLQAIIKSINEKEKHRISYNDFCNTIGVSFRNKKNDG